MAYTRRHRWLKISDREVDTLREHFGNDPRPPVSLLAEMFNVTPFYMSEIFMGTRRRDTSLGRRVNRRK